MEANLIQVFQNKVKILVSHLKESDAAILGASALAWDQMMLIYFARVNFFPDNKNARHRAFIFPYLKV